ncbi:MAG: hypothetical protein CMJ18_13860 [Phycisphaeraceae bacterium]|nr:hypothetical protein [Phycisphaeraceae bacterium]
MRGKRLWTGVLCALITWTMTGGATADDIGTHVGISTISPCPSFCGPIPPGHTDFAFDGGAGDSFASTSIDNIDGTGEGFASLDGPTLLPLLGAEAFSNANAQVSTNAVGMRSYLYTGASETTISLDLNLEGTVVDPSPNDGEVRASIAVIRLPDLDFSTDYATLVFEIVPSESVLGRTELFLPDNAGLQSVPASIPFTLQPNDKIYVWAGIRARGTRGGSGDALNSLTAAFSDPTGLIPLPEPGTATMLILAMASLRRPHRRC